MHIGIELYFLARSKPGIPLLGYLTTILHEFGAVASFQINRTVDSDVFEEIITLVLVIAKN